MKNREIVCIHYAAEGQCSLGREGTFRKACQKCDKYEPQKGRRPARINDKRKKLEKIREKDFI